MVHFEPQIAGAFEPQIDTPPPIPLISCKSFGGLAIANKLNSIQSHSMVQVLKRKLHDERFAESGRAEMSPEERIDAVETINRLKERVYAEQAFPRVHRITRKTRR